MGSILHKIIGIFEPMPPLHFGLKVVCEKRSHVQVCIVRGLGWDQRTKKDQKEIKGTTKPLMAILHITQQEGGVFSGEYSTYKIHLPNFLYIFTMYTVKSA